MDNNKKSSGPVEKERWALKEVNTMKNPLAVQILALSIQILALVVILLEINMDAAAIKIAIKL